MTYAMKPLACDPTRIKGMSERLIVSHYENNYGGAVNRLNAITAQLADLDFAAAPVFVINGLKREELIAANSMILHELFFASLSEESAPEGELREALIRDFGSVDRWRSEFSAMGKAQGGGSGWVLLTWSRRDRKLVNQWAMDHTTTLAGGCPILALDMYEHSYHMITARERLPMSMPLWRRSTGRTSGARTLGPCPGPLTSEGSQNPGSHNTALNERPKNRDQTLGDSRWTKAFSTSRFFSLRLSPRHS
jgi:superoxide dismutase, Fe-Mn family